MIDVLISNHIYFSTIKKICYSQGIMGKYLFPFVSKKFYFLQCHDWKISSHGSSPETYTASANDKLNKLALHHCHVLATDGIFFQQSKQQKIIEFIRMSAWKKRQQHKSQKNCRRSESNKKYSWQAEIINNNVHHRYLQQSYQRRLYKINTIKW